MALVPDWRLELILLKRTSSAGITRFWYNSGSSKSRKTFILWRASYLGDVGIVLL